MDATNPWNTMGPLGPCATRVQGDFTDLARSRANSTPQTTAADQAPTAAAAAATPARSNPQARPTQAACPADTAFVNWLTNQGVSKDSQQRLASHGFTTFGILRTMQATDPERMGISNLGQIRLLQALITKDSVASTPDCPAPQMAGVPSQKPSQPAQPTPPQQPAASPLDVVNSQLASLLGSIPMAATAAAGARTDPTPPQPGEHLANPLLSLIPQQKPSSPLLTEPG